MASIVFDLAGKVFQTDLGEGEAMMREKGRSCTNTLL